MGESPSVELEIAGRSRAIAEGMSVLRLLPAAARRMVGPFIFVDHFGPVALAAGAGMEVPPHPHIGLATVTYLFEGELLHRDSLGSEQVIRPRALNWMSAGRGIVHSERSPPSVRESGQRVHGLQLWVALPTAREEDEPTFQHCGAESLPEVERPGAHLRVIAGSAFGATAPVRTASPLFYAEARLDRGAELELPAEHRGRAAYVIEGAVAVDGTARRRSDLLVFREGAPARLRAVEPATVMLFGGAPLDGERHIWWNFVSSSRERIERAKADWRDRRFPLVPGDETDFVPLPEPRGAR